MNDNEAEVIPFKPHLVVLTPEGKQADKDVVEMLEDYLARAKRGEIKWCAIAYLDPANTAYTVWAPNDDSEIQGPVLSAALGATSFLNHRLLNAALIGQGDDAPQPERIG